MKIGLPEPFQYRLVSYSLKTKGASIINLSCFSCVSRALSEISINIGASRNTHGFIETRQDFLGRARIYSNALGFSPTRSDLAKRARCSDKRARIFSDALGFIQTRRDFLKRARCSTKRARIFANARGFSRTRPDLKKRARCFANCWRRSDKDVAVMTNVHAVLLKVREIQERHEKNSFSQRFILTETGLDFNKKMFSQYLHVFHGQKGIY
ncbi:MAG TPA: hypothetical protein VK255_04055 [Patescibacteria group bacterium]|nr:hypothetical protein [Patescibacteria group bacterium]